MENLFLNTFMRSVSRDLLTADENFALISKGMKKLGKACRANSKMLFWTNMALLGSGLILYIHDTEIEKLKKDVEQLKSGEESEVKAE